MSRLDRNIEKESIAFPLIPIVGNLDVKSVHNQFADARNEYATCPNATSSDFGRVSTRFKAVISRYYSSHRYWIDAISFCALFLSRQLDDLRPAGSELRWATAFGIYAVSLGLLVIFQRGTQYLAVIQSERLSYFLSRQFFARLIRKTPDFFIKYNPTEIQSAQAQGSQSVAALVQIAFSALLPGLGTFILTLALLGSVIDAEIILIVCIYGVVFLTLVMLANRICRPFMERAINTAQENARFVGNALFMIEPLRYSGSSAWMKDQFARSAETVFSNWRAYALRRIVFVCTIGVATAVQFAVTFYLLLPRYQEGALSVGDLVLFNTLLSS
ncbi:ABC transporter transmembrane domain-containing protein [Rhizobium beringeri]